MLLININFPIRLFIIHQASEESWSEPDDGRLVSFWRATGWARCIPINTLNSRPPPGLPVSCQNSSFLLPLRETEAKSCPQAIGAPSPRFERITKKQTNCVFGCVWGHTAGLSANHLLQLQVTFGHLYFYRLPERNPLLTCDSAKTVFVRFYPPDLLRGGTRLPRGLQCLSQNIF